MSVSSSFSINASRHLTGIIAATRADDDLFVDRLEDDLDDVLFIDERYDKPGNNNKKILLIQ